jgi:ABC-2 type transport system ATP-binding protein
VIVAEALTRKYGSHVAVDGVSFRVPKGEVVGFLGPNGAGKSTTLKMVAGFLPPTSGRVTVAGYDVVEDSVEARRHLGYMPEAVPLYPEMRVEEYLAFRAEIKGVTRNRKAAVAHAMEQADVKDVARRLIGELSKGYKQRVGLADALVASPELLILDEPTAGLDPNQILQVRELIKSLGREHTILLSTHILPEVEAVCSRVVIIARGRVAAEGTPDEIRARLTGGAAREAILVVRGDDGAVRAALGAVRGAKIVGEPVRLESYRGSEGVYRFTLELEDRQDQAGEISEALVAACVAARVGVRGLEVRGKSLEAIFHELTTAEAPVTEAAGATTAAEGRAS